MTTKLDTDSALRFANRYPELGTGPIPSSPFVDPEYFEKEKEHIFKKMWIHVGRVEEIPNKGDFFVRDLPACDANLIIVRSDDNKIKAFHNVCSHRQNSIVYENKGHTRRFFCKFHGWTYDLDGKLTNIPDRQAFGDLNEDELAMDEVSCDVWQGFIFINMQTNPAQTLHEFIEPMFGGMDGYPFDKLTACYAWDCILDTNWKFALDANQETYHVGFVHRRSVADSLGLNKEGLLHPIDGECGEFHRRLSIAGNRDSIYGNPSAINTATSDEESTPKTKANPRNAIGLEALRLGRGGTVHEFRPEDLPKGLNWTNDPNWLFDINVIFPNFYMAVRPNYVQAYTFYPLSHDKTLFAARVYYPEMKTAGGRFYQEYMKVTLRDVLLEDMGTLEYTQRATNTQAKPWMYLQDNEIMVRHSNAVVARLIDEEA